MDEVVDFVLSNGGEMYAGTVTSGVIPSTMDYYLTTLDGDVQLHYGDYIICKSAFEFEVLSEAEYDDIYGGLAD
jgi:hypothetical protein